MEIKKIEISSDIQQLKFYLRTEYFIHTRYISIQLKMKLDQ